MEAFGVSWRLASVVIHHGRSINRGHYTTLSRRNGIWVELNDSSAKEVPESDLDKYTTHSRQNIGDLGFGPKSTAYLLIYEKVLNGDQAVVEID
jgi:ubiquitin C-terminal hydrolase